VWVIVIFSVSSIPDLSPNQLGVTISDKIGHLVEFGILAFLVLIAVWPEKLMDYRAWIVLASGLIVAALDELWQIRVPGRESDVLDWVADATGFTLVWLIGRSLARARYRG
jgi:VanZ family protein